ncbi:hypothetical protein SAMN05216548_104275 [Faunimonas pinastri]|uniref:HNH endonuclease 5 domain-containing protein n=1 Tax=Faunimonas pinastri TaxID=1855383 RepID=A0A1H9G1C2_9HYPH|nr:hypothetical protein [Faunimonas pinastri]SEQ43906.1 hypothetical protein SAMN05216548_104275 [Faunimonas pinastri]
MRQIPDYGDDRNKGYCVHCGSGADESRDHVPSKVFLDEPLPENVAVASSCRECNHGFSLDEQYMACLLECVMVGFVDPDRIERSKISRTLRNDAKLAATLASTRQDKDGRVVWDADMNRIKRVVIKHARCHMAYELNEPQIDEPEFVLIKPLELMSADERRLFEQDEPAFDLWPEVGSRALNRLLIAGPDVFSEGWLVVQQGRYRYRVTQHDGNRVRMVFRDYLGCEVAW